MMKKYLLKGKEFLLKKMEEMDLTAPELDYVAEQIPRRLRDKLRILENADYDLEPASSYANYFRTYPNHPISPLLAERMKDQKPVQYKLRPGLMQRQSSIPPFDPTLQSKAMMFKHIVDSYSEGLPQLESNPLVCICVVHFHHKRGTEVEYRYPFNDAIEKLESRIVHNAMPDSSHNKPQDYNFFNFEAEVDGVRRMLFGVSYFKQIRVTEAMKAKNEELTRSHLQKAVCVISLLPVFGYLKGRLAATTKLFFEDFTNFESVKHAYMDINKHLTDSWKRLELAELHIGSDLCNILKLFRHKFFELYKAVLQQKRIVVFSHSSSSSSSFILSLLSLFPGMLTFGMHSQPIDRYLEGLREYALPLKLFSSDNPLILSFHIQDFHLLDRFKKDVRGNFLIGTTNRLIKESKNHGIQVLVNLEDCSIEFVETPEEEPWEGISKTEKHFMDEILEVLQQEFTCGYEGSQDWIRDRFHSFLKERLAEFVDVKNKYLQFLEDCRQYTSKRKKSGSAKTADPRKESYDMIEDEDEQPETKKSRESVPIVDERILRMPLVGLLGKPHFMYFLQFHNPNLYLLTERYPVDEILAIDNFEYYLGSLPKRGAKEFIAYNVKTKKLRFGSSQKSNKTKELKFDDNDEISEVYIGGCEEGKYHGPGFVLTENDSYQGDFLDGSKHGLGKLTTPNETYIGGFQHGLYNGEGQLVTKDGSIYSGHFREGMKDGQGRLQKTGIVYQGDFQQNQMWGKGNITYEAERLQIFGPFVKGKLDESEECVVKYSNGDAYAGRVRDLKANGHGTLRLANGQILEGEFRDGRRIDDS